MTLSYILDNELKFVLVGGKGGVGKSTIASTIAIKLAESGKKVLIISTDPAHSLSDSFDIDFSSGEITKVESVNGDLSALEIHPDKASDEFSGVLGKQLDPSQFSHIMNIPGMEGLEGITDDLKEIPPPGLDEALSFIKILEFADDERFDTVVLDTAPTGHTLRLLNIPEFLDSFLGRMLKMKTLISNTMTMIKAMFGGKGEKDNTVEIMENMKERVIIARDQLTDATRTQFVIVTIPTLMGIFETERLAEELHAHNIPNEHVVVNQINPDSENCQYCKHRRAEHEKNIAYIKNVFQKQEVTLVESYDREIRGVSMLQELGTKIF